MTTGWLGRYSLRSATGSIALAKAITITLLLVRLIAVFRHQNDIDEAQNLHLVYGWLEGELPYRDRFDNHAPLFSLLFVPMAALLGETPHVVMLARLALFPLGLAIVWLVHRIASVLTSRDIAWWTVAILLAFPGWSLKTVEFRPDVVWAFFWFCALWLLVRKLPRLQPGNSFLVGVFLGLALCTSIKTTFLVPALGVGCVAAYFLSRPLRQFVGWRSATVHSALAIAGMALPPTIVFGWFVSQGTSIETLQFCLFDANRLPFDPLRVIAAAVLAPIVLVLAWRLFREPDRQSTARGIVFLAAGAYMLALVGFAPELRKQTFIVAYPIIVVFACRFVFSFSLSFHLADTLPRLAAAVVCGAASIYLVLESALWRDGLRDQRELLVDVLAFTDNGEYLLDGRGETIFADRPVYLTYVDVTAKKMESGDLAEPDTAALANTTTSIVIGSLDGLPASLRRFLKQNYLKEDDGRLRAAGKTLKPSWENGRWIARIEILIPGEYLILKNGIVAGELSALSTGLYTLDFGVDRTHATLLWKEAWEDGFRPGPLQKFANDRAFSERGNSGPDI